MFIFVLGRNNYYRDSYMEDIIELVSTDIQNVLDYLSIDRMSYTTMTDYSILVRLDGEKDFYEELCVNKSMYEHLIEYPSSRLLEYESEYDDMKNKVVKWCENIFNRLEEEKKKKEESERLKKEYAERALYEKLKRKYEGE
ncbi:hypothetical protein IMSAGC013_02791 [Lachnospiraceae bacterium]|jgi:hypothetical protein|nr:hypothetical protein IMSAGC013_02791 [Lachnospiraceae bacterium]